MTPRARKAPERRGPRRGRPPGPWVSEKAYWLMPAGSLPLLEQLATVMRRMNPDAGPTDGIVIAEALLVLADQVASHPRAMDGERAAVRERAAAVSRILEEFYTEYGHGRAVRP